MAEHSWDGKGKGSERGNRFFMRAIRLLGVVPAYFFLIGACVPYVLLDRKTRNALRSFRSKIGLRTTVFFLYRHVYLFGMSLIDRMAFLMARRSPFSFVTIGEERIADACKSGNGVILLSAHVGNTEIAGNLLVDRLATPVNVVMLDAEREELQRTYRPATEKRRIAIIPLVNEGPETSIALVNCLRRGEIVALMGDRLLDGQYEELEFLGAAARFPRGPFALAAITGAPIIPVFTLKAGLLKYSFRSYDAISFEGVDRANRDEVIRQKMGEYVKVLEKVVREHPYQWFNFFEFWK